VSNCVEDDDDIAANVGAVYEDEQLASRSGRRRGLPRRRTRRRARDVQGSIGLLGRKY
jgi:hypothetical protein